MESVILVIHLILALAIIGLVLLQRSEGGGIGIGGGGGMGAFASAQTTASALSRISAICVAGFFVTSLVLGVLAGTHHNRTSIMDQLDQPAAPVTAPAEAGTTEAAPADVPVVPPEQPSAPVAQ